MLTTPQTVAVIFALLVLLLAALCLVEQWRENRRIERIWRRHTAEGLTPKRAPLFSLTESEPNNSQPVCLK